MPITLGNPFKGRHYSGDVILLAVRWYLRYPLAYEHVAEMEWQAVSAIGRGTNQGTRSDGR
jgi:hypothetical protein